jgi:hypothetical protein
MKSTGESVRLVSDTVLHIQADIPFLEPHKNSVFCCTLSAITHEIYSKMLQQVHQLRSGSPKLWTARLFYTAFSLILFKVQTVTLLNIKEFFYVYHEPKAQKHFLFLDAKVQHVSTDNAMNLPN